MVIRTNCPACGAVDVSPDRVRMQPGPVGQTSTYSFFCPGCGKLVVKAANLGMLKLFRKRSFKVKINVSSSPERKFPALTYDDLLDFHFQLQSDAEIAGFFDQSPS